jgi:hypothetical protein
MCLFACPASASPRERHRQTVAHPERHRGQFPQGRLPMSNRSLRRRGPIGRGLPGARQNRVVLRAGAARRKRDDRNASANSGPPHGIAPFFASKRLDRENVPLCPRGLRGYERSQHPPIPSRSYNKGRGSVLLEHFRSSLSGRRRRRPHEQNVALTSTRLYPDSPPATQELPPRWKGSRSTPRSCREPHSRPSRR